MNNCATGKARSEETAVLTTEPALSFPRPQPVLGIASCALASAVSSRGR